MVMCVVLKKKSEEDATSKAGRLAGLGPDDLEGRRVGGGCRAFALHGAKAKPAALARPHRQIYAPKQFGNQHLICHGVCEAI